MGQPERIKRFINHELITKSEAQIQENLTTSDPGNLRAEVIGLPLRFKESGFKGMIVNEDNQGHIKICHDYFRYETEKNSLVFLGNIGTGKTRLAIATLRNLKPLIHPASPTGFRRAKAMFIIADEFFQTLNDAVRNDSKLDIIKKYLQYDITCLDDLCIENFSPAKQENLYLFINRAYLDERKIIITTNFSMENLKSIDPRITDRLKEMAHFLLFEGKSFRS